MKKKDLKIVFMGTPEFAVESLKTLVENGYNIVAVVTQPDKPVGRHGSVLQAPAVKQYAISKDIPVLQPEKMKDETFIEKLHSYNADLQVVVAFRMLPEVVWAMPRFGTFNVHASLLPQYRGAAPINWAIINGEKETGVTTFLLDKEIDTGRIIMQDKIAIDNDDTAEVIHDRLMTLGAEICMKTVDLIMTTDGKMETHSQTSDASLKPAPKLFRENTRIDWNKSAKKIHDFVRGLSPYPTAWTMMIDEDGKEQPVKIFKTELKDGEVMICELQVAGKKRMSYDAFLNGLHGKHFRFE